MSRHRSITIHVEYDPLAKIFRRVNARMGNAELDFLGDVLGIYSERDEFFALMTRLYETLKAKEYVPPLSSESSPQFGHDVEGLRCRSKDEPKGGP